MPKRSAQNNSKKFYSISEVADQLNVSTHLIRKWENEINFEPARDERNYRIYTKNDIDYLKSFNKQNQTHSLEKPSVKPKPEPKEELKVLDLDKIIKASSVVGSALALMIVLVLTLGLFNRNIVIRNDSILDIQKNITSSFKSGGQIASTISGKIISRFAKTKDTINEEVSNVLGERDRAVNYVFEINIPTELKNSLTVEGPATFESTITTGTVSLTGIGSLSGLTSIDTQTSTTLEDTLELTGDITGPLSNNTLADDITFDGDFESSGTLNITGELQADGEAGEDGQVLTSTGSTVEWLDIDADEADTLDDLDSLQFLRSDTSDSFTSGTLSFSDGTFLDLSSITHNDVAPQGIKLPQNTALTAPSSGEGYIAYDTDDDKVYIYNGSAWTDISGASTPLQEAYDAGSVVQMSAASGDLRIYNDGSDEILFLDESTGRIGVGTTSPSTIFHISSTDGLIIPVGTTVQRPGSPTTGTIRYNSTSSQFEGYGTSSWGSLGGVIDVDQDTYISAENSPGDDNDDLRFFTAGTERMFIKEDGNIGIGTTNPSYALDVSGTAGFSSTISAASIGADTDNSVVILNSSGLLKTDEIDPDVWTPGTLADISSGTTNYLPIWSDSDSLGTSSIYETGGQIGIGTTAPGAVLDVYKEDAGTNTEIELFRISRETSGTAANGLGAYQSYFIEDSGGSLDEAGRFGFNARNATTGNDFAGEFSILTEREGLDDMEEIFTGYATGSYKMWCGNASGDNGPDCFAWTIGSSNNARFIFDNNDTLIWDYSAPEFDLQGASGIDLAFTTLGASNTINFDQGNDGSNMFIDSDGEIGIGTTAPSNELEVVGRIHTTNFTMTNGASDGYYLQSDASGNASWAELATGTDLLPTGTEGEMLYNNAGTWTAFDGMYWDDSNNYLGIGTTAPTAQLDLAGASSLITNSTGDITIDAQSNDIKFSDDNLSDIGNVYIGGNLGVGTTAPSTTVHISATDGLIIPVGTTAQRPATPTTGTVRYNSTTSQFEGYGASNWGSLGGVIDVDQDTYISAENNPGDDNDDLRFFTAGNEVMFIKEDGNVGIGTTNPGSKLQIAGNITPTADDTYDLGSDSLRWQDLYLGPSTLHIGTSTSDEYTISYDTTNDYLGFNVNGSGNSEIVFDSSGNVGIGTTNPTSKLEIGGGATLISNTTGDITFNAASDDIAFSSDNLKNITDIYIGGDIGIGTTAPAARLEIQGDADEIQQIIKANSSQTADILQIQDSAGNADIFIIDGSENIGIGTTGPGAKLEVEGSAYFGAGSNLKLSSGEIAQATGTNLNVVAEGATADLVLKPGNAEAARFTSDGYLGIGITAPSVALDVVGDIEYTGTITDVSDITLKENITPLTSSLSKLGKLKGFTFTMIEDSPGYEKDRYQIGLSAQDVLKVFPEAVSIIDSQGHLGLDYTQLVPPLIEAVKELDQKVEDIEIAEPTDISGLESDLEGVKSDIAMINDVLGLSDISESTESTESSSTLSGLTDLIEEMTSIFNEFKEFTEALGLSKVTDEGGNDMLAVNSDMNVVGSTTLSDVNITGDLMAGLIKVDSLQNSINISGPDCTLTSNDTLCDTQTLYLQKNLAGNVNILDGVLIIEPSGSVKVDGTLEAEKVLASNVSIKQTSDENSNTVGENTILANETQVVVENNNVNEDSKIFITPTTSTGGQSLIVKDKQDGQFTVKLDNSIDQDIEFDWWIVNVE